MRTGLDEATGQLASPEKRLLNSCDIDPSRQKCNVILTACRTTRARLHEPRSGRGGGSGYQSLPARRVRSPLSSYPNRLMLFPNERSAIRARIAQSKRMERNAGSAMACGGSAGSSHLGSLLRKGSYILGFRRPTMPLLNDIELNN